MSGLCGWRGSFDIDAAQTVRRMGERLARFDGSPAQHWSADGAALCALGSDKGSGVHERDGVHVAIVGHPRWDGNERSPLAVGEICDRVATGYRRQGAAALQSLRGDFALALFDAQRDELLLAVDRIGVRNLIFEETGRGLVFASTADALCAHPAATRDIEPQGIYDYLYFHMIPAPGTLFRNHRRLLPGHYLLRKAGRLTVLPYWEMRFKEDGAGDVASLKPGFLAALREAVGASLDRESCGAFLSGGTDSSTVSGLIGELSGAPAQTFSIGFAAEGYDEMAYARIAARHFKTRHHEYYVTPEDVVKAVPLIAAAYDQPFGNASAVPTYFCAKLARENGVTRMLGGDGGDELFGGNSRYAKQYQLSLYESLPRALRKGLIEPSLRNLPGVQRMPLLRKAHSYVQQASQPMPGRYESYNLLERLGPASVLTSEFLSAVSTAHPLSLLEDVYRNAKAHSLINHMLAIDVKFTLADNDLPKVTRMCELAGVDVTFPMLHEAVVDFSAALAPRLKLKGTRLRYFFKEALRGFLPDEILTKEKHGFGLPVGMWLQNHAPLNGLAADALTSLKDRHIVRPEFIDSLLNTHLRSHAGYYGTMVWILMMLELWLQVHMT